MRGLPSRYPEHGAETARVGVANQDAVVERKIHMIVLAGVLIAGMRAQGPRHAEVTQYESVANVPKQVFAAANHVKHGSALELLRKIGRYRPAQPPIAHGYAGNSLTLDMRQQAQAGGFNFG